MVNVKARITPICTGNTKTKPGKVSFPRDHPRIHGEHFLGISRLTMRSGSPPHTRGTQRIKEQVRLACRIHPRIHGEHRYSCPAGLSSGGSPPHTRGTPVLGNHFILFCRITPAYTGNTALSIVIASLNEDHPRIHGEHSRKMKLSEIQLGSPPHTRGTLWVLIL